MKTITISDIYGKTRSFTSKEVLDAASNDLDNLTGDFLDRCRAAAAKDDMEELHRIGATCSLGGDWRNAKISG